MCHREEMRYAYEILIGKPKWKKPRGESTRRWQYVQIHFKSTMSGALNLSISVQGPLVNTVMNFPVAQEAWIFCIS